MEQSKDNHFIPMTSINSGTGKEVCVGVYCYTNQIVNVVMIGFPGLGDWVMVDTGMPKCGQEIIAVANKRFGGKPPRAILLTHGHFDHVGGIVDMIKEWNVPVYAHSMEFPFLTGKLAYPNPDTSVEGGFLAKISSIYPHEPIDIKENLLALPFTGSVPFLSRWHWVHVPGHSPGQVAFFREDDGLLISADALITVRQDSFYKVLLQTKELNGPPRYLTTDWKAAEESVKKLYALHPKKVIPMHGEIMYGEELALGLKRLAENFKEIAVPTHGKFVSKEN